MRKTLIWAAAVVVLAAIVMLVIDDRNADDEAEIRAVVRDYATATLAGDGQRACALMTSGSQELFALAEKNDCASFMRAFSADLDEAGRDAYRNLAIGRVEIDDSTAEVEVGDELGSLTLANRGDRWLLDFEGPGRVEIVDEEAPATIGDQIAAPPDPG